MAHTNIWSVHVLYGGEWIIDPITNDRRFMNYKRIETLLLKEDTSFTELVNCISSIMELDEEIKNKLIIEYLPKYLSKISTLPIKNDYHVQCFLNEIIKRSEDSRIPICVTVREIETIHAEDGASNSPVRRLSYNSPIWTNGAIHSKNLDENIFNDNNDDNGKSDEDGDLVEETTNVAVPKNIVVEDVNIAAEQPGVGVTVDPVQEDLQTHDQNERAVVQFHTTRLLHVNCSTSSDRLSTVVDVAIKDVFETRDHLFMRMSMLAVKHFFEWKVVRANSKFWYLRCKDKNCKWKLNASAIGNSSAWKITKYQNIHTCQSSLVQCDNRQANIKVIGAWIKSKYQDVCRPCRPGEIMSDIRQELGVNITYNKAWRSRESVLDEVKGKFEDSYRMLPSYLHVLKALNPGTFTELQIKEDGRFKYLFFSFGASLRGFRSYIRPVIAVDAYFMKGKYSVLVATCLDGNNEIYPIGWGIVDSENDASWEWFLQKLKAAIGDDIDDLVFVSDIHESIGKAIANVFPNSFHGVCIYHLNNNLRAKFKKEDVLPLYSEAAKAYTLSEFNEIFRILSLQNSRVSEYLREIGVERWSRAHSDGRQYTIMTINIAECINVLLKDAQELPIHSLVDYIRNTLQIWFDERRITASKMNTLTTTWIEGIISYRMEESQSYVVEPVDMHRWSVRDMANRTAIVDLHKKTCTCRVFDMDQLPCVHALATTRHQKIDHYTLCSSFYHTNALLCAYVDPIIPVGEPKDWIVPEEVLSIQLSPLEPKFKSGKRKKKRISSTGEEKVAKKCGRCGESGHNRQTCSNPFVAREKK